MKKLTWKRIVFSLIALCLFCIVSILTDNSYFFFAGVAAFIVIIISAFIG